MDVSAISQLMSTSKYANTTASMINTDNNTASFDSLFQSALSMVNDTNSLTNAAQEEEMKYAMGYSDSTHDLQVAQQKANISLQYTVAVRNSVLDAYKEIMNLQF